MNNIWNEKHYTENQVHRYINDRITTYAISHILYDTVDILLLRGRFFVRACATFVVLSTVRPTSAKVTVVGRWWRPLSARKCADSADLRYCDMLCHACWYNTQCLVNMPFTAKLPSPWSDLHRSFICSATSPLFWLWGLQCAKAAFMRSSS